MPAPTIANIFGANASVIVDTQSVAASINAPLLIIHYTDFNAEGWNSLLAGDEIDPEKWLTAIIKKINAFSNANLDDLPNAVITDPIVGLESRNTILKRRYSYSVDIYQPDTGASFPDPDLV